MTKQGSGVRGRGSGNWGQGSGVSTKTLLIADPRHLIPDPLFPTLDPATPCSWCSSRPAEQTWKGKKLCRGCWIDLTVCEFVRVWRDDPGIRESLAYKGVDLASPFEYDLLHELIRAFAFEAGEGKA